MAALGHKAQHRTLNQEKADIEGSFQTALNVRFIMSFCAIRLWPEILSRGVKDIRQHSALQAGAAMDHPVRFQQRIPLPKPVLHTHKPAAVRTTRRTRRR